MPYAERDDCRIHYTVAGESETPVVLLGEVGFGAWQWSWQYGALAGPFKTVVVDTRGAGRSETPPGPYSMDELVADVVEVLRACNIASAHLVGCGLGGCVALAIAQQTNRAKSLTLIGTPPSGDQFDPADLSADPADTEAIRAATTALLSNSDIEDAQIEQIVEWRLEEDSSPQARDAQLAAIDGFAPTLYEITQPALVVSGEKDSVVPSGASKQLAEELPRGSFQAIPTGGHLVTIERSTRVADELLGFLETVEEDSD